MKLLYLFLHTGVAKHQNFKVYEQEPPNDTDVEAALQQIKDNDPKLKELNLNNIKVVLLKIPSNLLRKLDIFR